MRSVTASRPARASVVGVLLALAGACGHDPGSGPAPGGATGTLSLGLPNGARVDTLVVGQRLRVSLTWAGGSANGRPVKWSSEPLSVATVASDGTVTGLAPGGATVSATSG